MSNTVSIATKPLVYSTFRYIANHAWNAIGEYVDNSIQSYESHIDQLKPINPGHKLRVSIDFDFDKGEITIKDNAFGIDEKNFERAFELANVPLDNSGLNEFGMGMKVSSIWLSNLWTVETSAYEEPVKKTVIFDLEEVIKDQRTSLNVISQPCSVDDHYTIIKLQKLSLNSPTARQIPTIKKHLASIYTKFLRKNIVEIIVDGEMLHDTVLHPLFAPYYKNPKSTPITWKKDINFEAGNYKVTGFIGILEKMSTSTDNGFLLFRRNKVIGTSYDTKFRPKALCGETGSPRYKRIYGELELEGFSVSFTKNAFTQDDDLDVFIEALAEDLKKDPNFKIFDQAQKYTPTKTPKERNDVGQQLVNNIAGQGSTTPIIIKTSIPSTPTAVVTPVSPKPEEHEVKEIKEQEIPVTAEDISFKLIVGASEESTSSGLYDLVQLDEDHYKSNINLKNPFFERFSQIVSNSEDYKPVASLIRTMIVSEVLLLKRGELAGAKFRNMFNGLVGNIDV